MSHSISLGIKPRSPSLRGHLIFCYKNEKKKKNPDMTLKNILPLSNMSQIMDNFFTDCTGI